MSELQAYCPACGKYTEAESQIGTITCVHNDRAISLAPRYKLGGRKRKRSKVIRR